MTNDTPRRHGAFISARYSTEHQHSIEEQVERCILYCQSKHIPVLGIYADEGISGTKLHRPQYDRMMEDLRAGLADTVVIYDQSRLMRDVSGWFGARRELADMGVTVCSATQEYVGGNINKPDTYMMEGIQAIFDHMHVLTTKEKVTEKLHYMAKTGLHTGGRPALGYKTIPTGVNNQKRLVVEESEAAIVLGIFQLYDSGKSYKQVIDTLNAEGRRTKQGKPFGNNSLHDLLKNPLYTGKVVYGSRKYRDDGTRNSHRPEGTDVVVREDESLRIIPQELFESVQRRMALNAHNKTGRPASARSYPLRGKVFCGECGSAMAVAASKSKGSTYYYYRCAKKDRTHDCDGKPIRCDELEQMVAQQVRAFIANADIRDRVLKLLEEQAAKINRTGIERCERIIADLHTVKGKISRIIDAIEDGVATPSMKERLLALEEEKDTLQLRLDQLERNARVAALPAQRFREMYATMMQAAQNDIGAVLAVVARVEVYNEYIKVYTAFDPDPEGKPYTPDSESEFIISDGLPSGVPSLIITGLGLALVMPRRQNR